MYTFFAAVDTNINQNERSISMDKGKNWNIPSTTDIGSRNNNSDNDVDYQNSYEADKLAASRPTNKSTSTGSSNKKSSPGSKA